MSNGNWLHEDLSKLRNALREELQAKADKDDIIRIENKIEKALDRFNTTEARSLKNWAVLKTMLWGVPLLITFAGVIIVLLK